MTRLSFSLGAGLSSVLLLSPALASAQTFAPYTFSREAPPDLEAAKKAAAAATKKVDEARAASATPATAPDEFLALCNYFVERVPRSGLGNLPWANSLGDRRSKAELLAFSKRKEVDLGTPPSETMQIARWAIGACSTLLAKSAGELTTKDEATHIRLVSMELSLSRLEKWERAYHSADPNPVEVMTHAQMLTARAGIEQTMRDHSLLNSFAASAFAGVTRTSTPNVLVDPATSLAGLNLTESTKRLKNIKSEEKEIPEVSLTVESAHFGWKGERFLDYSFRARIAAEPVLSVVGAQVDGVPTKPIPVSVVQQGIVTSFGLRAGAASERLGTEFSAFGNVGASILPNDPVILDASDPPITATHLTAPAPDRAAWFGEVGMEFAMFGKPVRLLHAEKGYVSPGISISAAFRKDERYNPANLVGIDSNPRRFVLRALIDPTKLLSSRDDSEGVFAFGFGLEYDRPWFGTTGVRANTRLLIRGSFNLVKAATPEKEKKKDESGSAGK